MVARIAHFRPKGIEWKKSATWLSTSAVIRPKFGHFRIRSAILTTASLTLNITQKLKLAYLVSFWSILFWEIGQFFLGVWPTRGRCEMIVCIPTWILQSLFCCRYQSLLDCHWLKLETLLDRSILLTIESMNQKDLKSIIWCLEKRSKSKIEIETSNRSKKHTILETRRSW